MICNTFIKLQEKWHHFIDTKKFCMKDIVLICNSFKLLLFDVYVLKNIYIEYFLSEIKFTWILNRRNNRYNRTLEYNNNNNRHLIIGILHKQKAFNYRTLLLSKFFNVFICLWCSWFSKLSATFQRHTAIRGVYT